MGDKSISRSKGGPNRSADPYVSKSLNGEVGDRLANHSPRTRPSHLVTVKADVEHHYPIPNKSWPCSPSRDMSFKPSKRDKQCSQTSSLSDSADVHTIAHGNGDCHDTSSPVLSDGASGSASPIDINGASVTLGNNYTHNSPNSDNDSRPFKPSLSSPVVPKKQSPLGASAKVNFASDIQPAHYTVENEPVKIRKRNDEFIQSDKKSSKAKVIARRLSGGEDDEESGAAGGGNKSPGSQSVASLASNTTFLSHAADGVLRSSQRHTLGEILRNIETKSKVLLERTDFTGLEPLPDLTFLAHQSRYNSDGNVKRRLINKLTQCGVPDIFVAVFRSVQQVDYLVEPVDGPLSSQSSVDSPVRVQSPTAISHPRIPSSISALKQNYGVGYEECRSLANEKLHNVPPSMKNLRAALTLLVNTVAISDLICEQCIKRGIPALIVSQLTHPQFADNLRSQNRMYLVKGYLSVLLSVLKFCPEHKDCVRATGIPALQPYLHCGLLMVKTRALLLLSYLVGERDAVSDRLLGFLVRMLSAAMDDTNHQAVKYGVTALEIASAINRFSTVEVHKDIFVARGILPLYTRMMHPRCHEEEQMLAAKGIWSLAFSAINRPTMADDRACLQALEYLESHSTREEISKTASGAIFVIKGKHLLSPLIESVATVPHILISYQWGAKAMVFKIKERLIAQGYKVCTDVQNVDIPIMDGMCETVQHAAVVLLCLTAKYKDSPSCRTEAEYAKATGRDLLALVLEPNYSPDGWVLRLLDGLPAVLDLTNEETLGSSLPVLVRELGPKARVSNPVDYDGLLRDSSASLHKREDAQTQTDELISAIAVWSTDNVTRWLRHHDLAMVIDKMKHIDGPLLLQMKKIKVTAPESFHTMCKAELKLNLATWLRFNHALDQL